MFCVFAYNMHIMYDNGCHGYGKFAYPEPRFTVILTYHLPDFNMWNHYHKVIKYKSYLNDHEQGIKV